jgi:catechol 2,3-dioxygenase-like lactoylglutathione lyase family enzyme
MIAGIHHVTAICGDPQRNIDFYAGVLGLRLVKRTVNFDDPQTYHLYYGDEVGWPGSLLTFFAWPDAGRGVGGPGQIAETSLAVAPRALGFWVERLLRNGVRFRGPELRRVGRIDERVLAFEDPDGLPLELVASLASGDQAGWDGGGVPAEFAITGVHGVTLWENESSATTSVLVDLLGLRQIDAHETTQRFVVPEHRPRSSVAVRTIGDFPKGNVSVGTVHHVAFRIGDMNALVAAREKLVAAGLVPTPVIDRMYFQSVYFREPGGVLFELATDEPGFDIDEPLERLGEELKLPPQYEPFRTRIAATLPEIHAPADIRDRYKS